MARFGQLLAGPRVGAGDRVLDFGCGSGWTSTMLARMGADVVGMDIAPAALEVAREVAAREIPSDRPQPRFATYGGDRIDAADEEFDFVVVNDAFHHFPNPRRLMHEFHRVLAPHGMFGFSEPGIGHAATAHSAEERATGVLEEDVDLEQLYQTAVGAGFRDLEVLLPPIDPATLTLPLDRARLFLRGVPGIVPTDLLRLTVLIGPIGILRKGPYAVTSLHPRSHAARIVPAAAALRAEAGASYAIAVEVTNPTETVWLREGRRGNGYVRLGAHLHDAAGAQRELDYGRAELPHDVPAGRTVRLSIALVAPAAPGRYVVRLDMVNEGVCWFAQQSASAVDVPLEVTSRS
jgi:protein-L-isoaspartate O-methyltransferase